VRGQDAVLVAVGTSARAGVVTVCADAVANVLVAMRCHRVRRLVVLSAYGVAETHEGGLYDRVVWLVQGRKMLDKERMEELVRRSAVDWTVVRPPALTNGPRTGRYRVGEDLRIGLTSRVSRADVADFMLRAAADAACVGRAPAIAS
jgi:putative NADH-flavin reductase